MAIEFPRNQMDKLHREINKDLDRRRVWRENVLRLRRLRLGERKKRLLYPNAPNFVEPIIDDNVNSITSSEIQILFQSRYLAHFIPLSDDARKLKRKAEVAFDTLLRFSLDFRAKVESLLDSKNEDGMAIAKMIENKTAYPDLYDMEGTIPDFEDVDPLDIIVPTVTKELRKAEMAAHIMRFTENEYRMRAKDAGWKNTEAVIERCKRQEIHQNDNRFGAPLMVGRNFSDPSRDQIVIWEVYHRRNSDRLVTITCPDAPDIEVHEFPWKWPDKIEFEITLDPNTGELEEIEEVIEQPERRWPLFQFRFEGRSRFYYDVRGVAHLVEDNQKAATQFLNLKGVQYDFYGKPLLEGGSGTTGLSKFRWRPGEKLPKGVTIAQMPKVDSMFNFDADLERAAAQRRVGSSQGSLSSILSQGRDRKTATEVSREARIDDGLSISAIARFSEPFGELFNEMWRFLRHNPVPLPMIDNRTMTMEGQTQNEIFEASFLVRPASSSRNVNPDFVLAQISQLAPFFKDNPAIRNTELTRFAFDQIDPHLTEKLVISEEGETALEQQLAQLQQQVQEMGKFVQVHNELLTSQIQTEEAEENDAQDLESLEIAATAVQGR